MSDRTLAAALPLSAPLRPEMATMGSSKIAEVWALGQGRKDVIGLWVGEGDLPTPKFICEASNQALLAGETFYSAKRGLPVLRAAIADYMTRHFKQRIDQRRVTVTASGMNAIMLALQMVLGPGQAMVTVTPVWPNAMAAARVMGGRVVPVGLESQPDGNFRLDLDSLADAIDETTRAIFVASPGNPTGWVMERDQQEALLEICRKKRIWLIADEVYHRFIYDRPLAPSFMEFARPDDPIIFINSFSKNWAMTGWRLGWMVTPEPLGETLDNLIEYNICGAPPFLQKGALAAICDGEGFVREMVERCRRGSELVFQRLAALPRVRLARPRGAFYAFFGLDGMGDSLATAKRILAETKVGLAPGVAFGPGGEGHLRLCFATSEARLSEALDRLEPALR